MALRCVDRPGCKALLALVMLLYAVAGQGATPVLDWQVLLAEPDPEELTELASQYEHAIGYRRDYGRARQLYCAAARLGYLPAQTRLAWMYANGLGAPRDTDLAAAWMEVVAANGDLQARKFLAFVGEPGVTRKPRCTYESRFDAYAVATIPGKDWDAGVNIASPERKQIAAWVRALAPDYGLDPNLILAIIQTESNFNPRARSPANAQGLMQLIPATAARFGVRDRTNPVQNLHGGMAYVRWLLSFFQGDLKLSLAGYNAGEHAVEKYLGIPPYRETQNYVRKVIRAYGRNSHPPIEPVVEPSRVMPSPNR
ncbi:MAG TPA: lytic transglycosylase [Gammaproteobacteria bacterium]|nr:lytic transglycosylase [Gammaproteobacteria bacterium]